MYSVSIVQRVLVLLYILRQSAFRTARNWFPKRSSIGRVHCYSYLYSRSTRTRTRTRTHLEHPRQPPRLLLHLLHRPRLPILIAHDPELGQPYRLTRLRSRLRSSAGDSVCMCVERTRHVMPVLLERGVYLVVVPIKVGVFPREDVDVDVGYGLTCCCAVLSMSAFYIATMGGVGIGAVGGDVAESGKSVSVSVNEGQWAGAHLERDRQSLRAKCPLQYSPDMLHSEEEVGHFLRTEIG
jgi:hypothetical protein